MRGSCLWILAVVVVLSGCSDQSPSAPSGGAVAGRLTVTISPTRLWAPVPGEQFVWNATYQEVGGIGVQVLRDEMTVVDDSGVRAAAGNGNWACSACPSEFRIKASGTVTISGFRATYLLAPRPGTFRYTVYYRDDRNSEGSTTVTVPVN